MILTCANCGREGVQNFGRGLCRKCYMAHRHIGSLDQFPPLPPTPGLRQQKMPMSEISYRQLDYWTRRGYLRAADPTPGSGNNRTWDESEHLVARTMARLTAAGLTLEAAHRAARGEVELAPGVVVLLVDSEAPDRPAPPHAGRRDVTPVDPSYGRVERPVGT